jgi:hypothetical protein
MQSVDAIKAADDRLSIADLDSVRGGAFASGIMAYGMFTVEMQVGDVTIVNTVNTRGDPHRTVVIF